MLPPRCGSIPANLETGRLEMQRSFEHPAGRAGVSLAVFISFGLIGPAAAASLAPATDEASRSSAAQCDDANGGCGRIRGHIPAAPVTGGVETTGRPPSIGTPPAPFVSGLGSFGQAAADAVSHGLFFLQVSHDESAR